MLLRYAVAVTAAFASGLAPGLAQVEWSVVGGAGLLYGSVTHYDLCGVRDFPTGSNGGGGPTAFAGLSVGSRPYAGWGWLVSAEASGRDLRRESRFEREGCGVEAVRFDAPGTYVDAVASVTHVRADWWGASVGAGVTAYLVPGADRIGYLGPVVRVGVFRALEYVTWEFECVLGHARLDRADLEVVGDGEASVAAGLWLASPRLRLALPFGRSRWLRRVRGGVPIYQPRG